MQSRFKSKNKAVGDTAFHGAGSLMAGRNEPNHAIS